MSNLVSKSCVPCKGGVPALSRGEALELLLEIPEWKIIDNHHLNCAFKFKGFITGLNFVNKVGLLAEEENHHPDILLSYSQVSVDIWTHKINGLTESDFILAAKVSYIFEREFKTLPVQE